MKLRKPTKKPKTREEILDVLVDLLACGHESHTDAVNGLADLLDEEKQASAGQAWVAKLEALPEPR